MDYKADETSVCPKFRATIGLPLGTSNQQIELALMSNARSQIASGKWYAFSIRQVFTGYEEIPAYAVVEWNRQRPEELRVQFNAGFYPPTYRQATSGLR
ncbi:MAG: hypothetical protein WCP21_23850 [Armatimonadota bacterium]